MAFETVNPLTAFWTAQGLKYLIRPEEESGDVSTAPATFFEASGNPSTGRNFVRPGSQGINKKVEPQTFKSATTELWMPAPLNSWPDIWRKRLEKTRRAKFAWTYWELGPDLDQMGDASLQTAEARDARGERSQFLRKLLNDLGHPAGTHTFWPCTLCDNEAWSANPEIFWSGLHELKCRGVIIFGLPAVKTLLDLEYLTPLTRMRIYSQFVWLMWDLETLIRDKQAARRFMTYIKEALKPFVRSSSF